MSNSPDVTPYVDLRLYDKDVQDIFESAKMHIESRLPDVKLREDHTETILLEAFSLMIAESAMAINRLPSAIMTALLKMYGSPFYEGKAPAFNIGFRAIDLFPYEVPAGTPLALQINDTEFLNLQTTAALVFNGVDDVAYVEASTLQKTSLANGVMNGRPVDLLDTLMFIQDVWVQGVTVLGEDPEDDATWLNRSVQRLNRLTDTLVTARHFQIAALEEVGVYRAIAIDNYNGITSTPGSAGHVSIAIYGRTGPITAPRKAEIKAGFQSRSMATLTVHVIDPTITTVNITTSVVKVAGYETSAVRDAIEATLRSRLSTESWDWRTSLTRNEIIAIIGAVPGVAYVDTITVPAGNVTLTGAAPLLTVGTTTITVA